MTLAALAHDPALPGLAVASDGEEMREVFRRHLRPLGTKAWEIHGCRVSRIHYHRGNRCTLRYTLRLVDPATGREWSQWVTGLIHADDRVDRLWHKLRLSAPEVADSFSFEPLALIPEPRMLVQVFPYDRRLPTLVPLTTPPVSDLEPVFVGRLGPRGSDIEAWDVEPVQYRPGRVAVLRHTVQTGSASGDTGRTTRFYVKVYRHEDEGRRAYRVVEMLWNRAGARGVTVARPIAYLGGLHALVLGEVAGQALRHVLLQDGDTSAVRTAAHRMAASHREPVPELPEHTVADEIATLERARQILEWARPELGGRIEEVVGGVAAGLDEVPASPTHRELKTDHIFLDGSQIGVIDVDSSAAADPLLDPARILADLAGLSLRGDVAGDRRWESAAGVFADEYVANVPRSSRDRLFVQYAGALLKEAVDLFQHQEPQWPEHVDTLVEEARNALYRRAWWAA